MGEIRFGPAGVPLSCKGRTLKDGVEDIHSLELSSMEMQYYNLIREINFEMDELQIEKLVELGNLSESLDVELSIHAPYYMDLVQNDDEMFSKSLSTILWCGEVAEYLGAKMIVTHAGLYGNHKPKEALENVQFSIIQLLGEFKKMRLHCKLGIETSGKQPVFGNLDEVLELKDNIPEITPVLNFAHIHSRNDGMLKKKKDFQEVFDRVLEHMEDRYFYTHFSGVEHSSGNELKLTPIKKGDMRFEPLADCLLDNDYDITVISGSPLLEHDAKYMSVIMDRVEQKRETKKARKARATKRKKSKKNKD